MKITKFRDIPQFVRDGSWECDFSLVQLIKYIDELIESKGLEQKLDINPDFQRGHVWTEAQQIAWLEFFLRGGKTSRVIYLNNPGWHSDYKGDFVLVDGKQRLEAIRRFINNEIPVFGSYYKEFTDKLSMSNTVKLNMNTLQTRKEVLQWYIDFNTAGVVHSPEEIKRVKELLAKEK